MGGRDRRHRLQTVGDRPVQLRGVDGVALGGSWPPASSTRPSSRVACDRYIVAWPSLGPAWYAGLGEEYRSISAVVATLPPAAMTFRPWLRARRTTPLVAPVGVQPAHRLKAAGQRRQESHPDREATEAHPGEEQPSAGGGQHVGVGGHAQPVGVTLQVRLAWW